MTHMLDILQDYMDYRGDSPFHYPITCSCNSHTCTGQSCEVWGLQRKTVPRYYSAPKEGWGIWRLACRVKIGSMQRCVGRNKQPHSRQLCGFRLWALGQLLWKCYEYNRQVSMSITLKVLRHAVKQLSPPSEALG